MDNASHRKDGAEQLNTVITEYSITKTSRFSTGMGPHREEHTTLQVNSSCFLSVNKGHEIQLQRSVLLMD